VSHGNTVTAFDPLLAHDVSALRNILPNDAEVFRARAGWAGRAFLVADVAFTAIDSWDDPPPGTPTVLKIGYRTVVGGVGGALVGGFAAAFFADEATDLIFNAVWEE
jgi:hypothetical protein